MSLKALEIVREEISKDRDYDPPCCEGLREDLLERVTKRIKEECGETPYESERIRIQEISRCHDCTSGYRCTKHTPRS